MRTVKITFITSFFLLVISCADIQQKPVNQEISGNNVSNEAPEIASCEHIDSLSFSPETPLYTSDCRGYQLSELSTVLDHLFATGKPVILFVHGRGNEPKKSLKGGVFVDGNAVHKLEAQYGARVLMFNWDSKAFGKDRERPLSHMKDAARALIAVLDGIKQYRTSKYQDRPFVLLAHSMGTIVMQTLVSEYGWPSGTTRLFSNVLLTGADADAKGHEQWVQKISVVENTYLSINYDDDILKKSTDQRPHGVLPLGREPGKTLAPNATYIDVSRLSSKKGKGTGQHEMFNKLGMHNQVYVCHFFDAVLKGAQPTLSAENVEKTIGKQRHALKFNRANDDSCFE